MLAAFLWELFVRIFRGRVFTWNRFVVPDTTKRRTKDAEVRTKVRKLLELQWTRETRYTESHFLEIFFQNFYCFLRLFAAKHPTIATVVLRDAIRKRRYNKKVCT